MYCRGSGTIEICDGHGGHLVALVRAGLSLRGELSPLVGLLSECGDLGIGGGR